jgi:hypothetical protein
LAPVQVAWFKSVLPEEPTHVSAPFVARAATPLAKKIPAKRAYRAFSTPLNSAFAWSKISEAKSFFMDVCTLDILTSLSLRFTL